MAAHSQNRRMVMSLTRRARSAMADGTARTLLPSNLPRVPKCGRILVLKELVVSAISSIVLSFEFHSGGGVPSPPSVRMQYVPLLRQVINIDSPVKSG